jgi:hypothetical protein
MQPLHARSVWRKMFLRLPRLDAANQEYFGVADRDFISVVATSRFGVIGLVRAEDGGPPLRQVGAM